MKSIAASNTANPAAGAPDDDVPTDDLSEASRLALDDVRRLCQTLAVELGLTPAGIQLYGSHVDLLFSSTVLLRPRQVLIRATTDPASILALDNVRAEAADRGCADYLLVSSHPSQDEQIAGSEHVLDAAGFIDLCRRSAMVEWPNRRPRVSRAAYQTARQRAEALSELDVLGLAWLPALARHRLPPTLRHSTVTADEWFERAVFCVITTVFRVNGHRLGSASRGKRVGDALLWWRGRLVLLDCKAAYSGYRLGVDDERRLLDYARQRQPGYCDSEVIDCVVLVSSEFPTFDADPKRFVERRRRFQEAGSNLACVRADDLVDAALAMLQAGDDTRRAESVAWHRVLCQGMVTNDRLLGACRAAIGGP
ncbi:MAG TPA: hypothetical protein VFB74_27170 [Kribbellaceae bacterium]|nr:hypothetical protein [Kribbellaceae bacterium]